MRISNFALAMAAVLPLCFAARPAGTQEVPPAADGSGIASTLQPGVGRGDFEFYLDVTSQRPAGAGGTLVRTLVQLPVRAFLEQTKANKADLRLQVRVFTAQDALARLAARRREDAPPAATGSDSLRDAYARGDAALETVLADFDGLQRIATAESRSRIEAADRERLEDTDFRIFESVTEVPPGDYVFEVVAENLSRGKRGLLDRLRHRPLCGVARLLVRVPDLNTEPQLADLAFESGHGSRSPYATRLYGLLNDSLHVRTTLYGHGEYRLRITANDRDGELAWQDSMQVTIEGAHEIVVGTSVNTLAAGQYVLQVAATGPQGTTVTRRGFDVAWSLVTWARSRRDVELEAELALDEKRFDAYRALPIGEKEKYLEDFWQQLDPSPNTAQNEVLDEFRRRVAYADLNYSEGVRGALTDRGRVYIHFGPPDELLAEAVPTHLAGQGAEGALEKVDDVYTASEHDSRTNWDRLNTDNVGISPTQKAIAQQERDRVIGPANEVTSYELWRYKLAGAPLLPEDKGMAFDAGLRVLFVDLTGYGQYRIRKSSIRLNIHGLSASS